MACLGAVRERDLCYCVLRVAAANHVLDHWQVGQRVWRVRPESNQSRIIIKLLRDKSNTRCAPFFFFSWRFSQPVVWTAQTRHRLCHKQAHMHAYIWERRKKTLSLSPERLHSGCPQLLQSWCDLPSRDSDLSLFLTFASPLVWTQPHSDVAPKRKCDSSESYARPARSTP